MKAFITGDSLAAGVGATSPEKGLAGRIATELGKHNHVTLTNVAISGSRMKDIKIKPKQKQDLTIIVASSNDLYHFTNKQKFETLTKEVLELHSKLAKKVVLVGPADIGGTSAIPLFMKPLYKIARPKYAAIMKKTAAKHKNAKFVNPAEFSMKPYGPTEAADGFHPNNSGHKYWADLILSATHS